MHTPSSLTTRSNTDQFGRVLFIFVCVMFFLCGCIPKHISTPTANDTLNSAIIVVPGYYGTRLVQETNGEIVWISPTEALVGDQPLTLPVPGLELNNTISLRPGTILDSVEVIPFLYSVDVYGSLLDVLQTSHHNLAEIIPLAYDWRKDLMDAVKKLDGTVQKLQASGKHDISLVAHSLGGLIVSYYLRYGTQDIESAEETWEGARNISKIVMAGVPFLGVMNSFRNMNFGVDVKLNTYMLTAEAYASFPSSYYTLPIFDRDQMLTPELQHLDQVIRTPENWNRYSWGLLIDRSTLTSGVAQHRADYMSYWLKRSQQFLQLLQAPLDTSRQPSSRLLYLYAKGRSTLAKGIWVSKDSKGPQALYFNNREIPSPLTNLDSSLLYEDGDETVTVRSSALPSAYHEVFLTTVHEYDLGHTELVTDPTILQDILTFLERS